MAKIESTIKSSRDKSVEWRVYIISDLLGGFNARFFTWSAKLTEGTITRTIDNNNSYMDRPGAKIGFGLYAKKHGLKYRFADAD